VALLGDKVVKANCSVRPSLFGPCCRSGNASPIHIQELLLQCLCTRWFYAAV